MDKKYADFNRWMTQLRTDFPAIMADRLEVFLRCFRCKRNELCTKTLAMLQGDMAQYAETPDGGWLPFLYEYLADGLFRNPDFGPVSSSQGKAANLYFRVLDYLLATEIEAFDPLTDLYTVDEAQIEASHVASEYRRFQEYIEKERFMALLRLGREIMPFDAASHTIGVHNVAVHMAQMAEKAGLPVDVPLVSAASLGHDIGKFGCRGEDAKRVPYLHYYYTWQWFSDRDMEAIAHISANHSTWDLEFENLPIESLLLIYADFRVRGHRGPDGKEIMEIYSLDKAYEIIFSKLYNMTPEKQKRYQTVFFKLHDFETYLAAHGVSCDCNIWELQPCDKTDPALLDGPAALTAIQNITFDNNIHLMNMLSTAASFDNLLEQARSEKNTTRIRTYLRLFDEYNTYMTKENKQKTLSFLYELLMHQESDVRRRAGQLMGQILANSGPKYRKERPTAAPRSALAPTMMALLDQAVSLWGQYIDMCLHPDFKITSNHAIRISNSLKTITQSLFQYCDLQTAKTMLPPLLERLATVPEEEHFLLVDALCHVPMEITGEDGCRIILEKLPPMLQSANEQMQISALRWLEHAIQGGSQFAKEAIQNGLLSVEPPTASSAAAYLKRQLMYAVTGMPDTTKLNTAQIYLSNLQNAVHWTVKLVQIDALCDDTERYPGHAFHTAMHLSNLLSVSEHLPVRESAGAALLRVSKLLTIDQRNEITVDLLRELENGQPQTTKLIPDYLGELLCQLRDKELQENLDYLEQLTRSGVVRPARAALRTLGVMMIHLRQNRQEIFDHSLGLLMTGIAHYEPTIHQTALRVLCQDLLSNDKLPMETRRHCFLSIHKKLLTLLAEPREETLSYFNQASMLNHLYRFVVTYKVDCGPFQFPAPKPVAFFPGTFDPFSVGHKRIVEEIRNLGFEVYLAIDEFSWSKRTLAKLLRRKIVNMSVADQGDTYIFPDEIPVNIAFPEDLERLQALFSGRDLYLVTGSDVIRNASAYRAPQPGGAAFYNHIVFYREESEQAGLTPLDDLIQGKLILLSLPSFFETVSSTRIREYIDKNMDISMLVDPVVQSYIYKLGLYLRSPQYKNYLEPEERCYRQITSAQDEHCPDALKEMLLDDPSRFAAALCSRQTGEVIAWACGRTLTMSTLLDALHSVDAASFVRRHTSGQIVLVEEISTPGNDPTEEQRLVINELLVRSLNTNHTYALCRCQPDQPERMEALQQLGFIPVDGEDTLYYVDMRAPTVLIQDVLLRIKKPHHDDPALLDAVAQSRPRLRRALVGLTPGTLLLSFDAEMLSQSLLFKIQQHNQVLGIPMEKKQYGKYMCVPYGKILPDKIVPNTVTKTLHVVKAFAPDVSNFSIIEYPGYSSLRNQIRTIKSFHRPVILVDDLLHKGYRLDKLNPLFRDENVEISKIVVGILSGRGKDLMQVQNRQVDCEYFIPNLHYWVTESLLYPFIGGDSVTDRQMTDRLLPSINLILPYCYSRHYRDATDDAIRALSLTALENAHSILSTLEARHQAIFQAPLTLRRLGEAIHQPRLPDRGRCLQYDLALPASSYLQDDIVQLLRNRAKGGMFHGV